MELLLFIVTILCGCTITVFSNSHGTKASAIPFRFHLASEQLPNQTYRVLSGSIPKAEEPIPFWPVGGKEIKKVENVLIPYTELSIPNPFQEPSRCVFSTDANTSWLCDPDMILNAEQQAYLESRLLRVRDRANHQCSDGINYPYQIAVVVVSNIAVSPTANETPQDAAHNIAKQLLWRWGIGNKNCHDGMLLLFVTNQNVASLAVREGVEKMFISDKLVARVEDKIKAVYSTNGDANAAILKGLSLIEDSLPITAEGISWIATIVILLLIIFCMASALIYVFCFWLVNLEFLRPSNE